MSIIIKQPMRENGISVSIQIPDSSDAGQIKSIIENNTQGNSTVEFNHTGVMDIEMYPIKNLSVGGKNIYGPIDLQEILEKLLAKFLLPVKRPIVIEPPSAAVGISVSINILGGFVEFDEIKKIIQGAVKSNLIIEKSGFRMNVHIYPLSRASIQGVNIYGPTDLLKSLNTLLDKYLVKPDPTKGRNLNPEPRNLKGEPRILTKYEPTEKIEESTEESTEESKKE
jgi:hypothetical protein